MDSRLVGKDGGIELRFLLAGLLLLHVIVKNQEGVLSETRNGIKLTFPIFFKIFLDTSQTIHYNISCRQDMGL